ncbi:hypothetical protein SARC_02059 [Sphaeroforma arctica JP610]|uniref:Uncharacterized protein n=1 Tax=Sphaeroforma arctica JP610 TaxID=667725 RepID=A0A0L0G9S8_9EUKA|nr:hypothetical protein SARC_02059 [Sphaeroforma arctica JP610]KNC85755.1 hypothetical protein SARC_02059 [Sphaeroforma arctica JP610]|eukprot:XP_014159657.1 hypothetical protein SARC_02059 [Sphaeroforma arctica JP610]
MPVAQFTDWVVPFDTTDIDSRTLNFSWVDLSQQLWGPYDIELFASHEDHVLVIYCTKDGIGAYGKDAYLVDIQFEHCYMNYPWRNIDPFLRTRVLGLPHTSLVARVGLSRPPRCLHAIGYQPMSCLTATTRPVTEVSPLPKATQQGLTAATDRAISLHDCLALREVFDDEPLTQGQSQVVTDKEGGSLVTSAPEHEAAALKFVEDPIPPKLQHAAFPDNWMQVQEVTEEEMSARRPDSNPGTNLRNPLERTQPNMSEFKRQLAVVADYTSDLTRFEDAFDSTASLLPFQEVPLGTTARVLAAVEVDQDMPLHKTVPVITDDLFILREEDTQDAQDRTRREAIAPPPDFDYMISEDPSIKAWPPYPTIASD